MEGIEEKMKVKFALLKIVSYKSLIAWIAMDVEGILLQANIKNNNAFNSTR